MAHLTVIADDHAAARRYIRALVEKHGGVVAAEATNGEEAVAAVRMTRPALLLLDVSMPIMTGIEALAEIRAAWPEAAVVMLTSLADAHTVKACLDQGASDFLRKDLGPAELSAAIAGLLAGLRPGGGAHG